MMRTILTSLQARVIGALMEKEKTTPEQYPLSLNALTSACNQKSSRDPVMSLSEVQVQNIIDELDAMNMLFIESGSRTQKYKQRFCNTEFGNLRFNAQQFAIICVLLLRGPQTPGELRTRTQRLADFVSVNEVEECLQGLTNINAEQLVMRLEKEPGKREARYVQLFTPFEKPQYESSSASVSFNNNTPSDQSSGATDKTELQAALERIDLLEQKVEYLEQQLDDLLS